MGIAGLSTYSSSSYYFAMSNKGKSEGTNTDAVFGLLSGKNDNKDTAELSANSTDVAMPSVPYTRCIMANIKTEEVYGARSEDGEMIYSYKASEQSFKMKKDIDSFFNPFFTQYLVDDIDMENYPDVAGIISEELSSEEIKEDAKVEETVTPLGIGFALAGNMGYGMSASLIEKPGCDDTIIRVKIATGGEDEFVDVNLSKFDPKNATPVEMFAYCEYMDSIGEGMNSKWGSWSALKMVMSPLDGTNFGSFENIMNKKMNWTDALSKAETSLMDSHTLEIKLTPADLIKMLEESHRITAQELKEDDDWRKMSDEEWDKLIEDVDKYIDAFKECIKQMKEAQEEAAKKAAMEADADMKTVAASQAATEAASGFGGAESSGDDGVEHEKNWTKILNTDDQTILMTAKEAQKMEKKAMSKFEEIQETDNIATDTSSVKILGKYRDNRLGINVEVYETGNSDSSYSVRVKYDNGNEEIRNIDADKVDTSNCNSIELFVKLKHLEKNGKCDNAFMNHILAEVYKDYRTPNATADTNIDFKKWFEQQLELEKRHGNNKLRKQLEELIDYL